MHKSLIRLLLLLLGTANVYGAPTSHDSAIEAIHAIRNDSSRISGLLEYAKNLEATKPADAIAMERSVVDEARRLHLNGLCLRGLLRLGLAYFQNADYTRSLNYFIQAQKEANNLQDRSGEVKALKGISVIYMRTHDLPKSLRYLKIADSVARRFELVKLLPDLLSEEGIRYAEAYQYKSAVACYREAILLARQLKLKGEELNARVNMATSLKNLGEFDEALSIYQDMLVEVQRRGDGEGMAIITGNMAQLYFQSGNPAQSERYALEALAIIDTVRTGRNYVQQDLNTLLIKLYEQRGAYPQAFAAASRLLALKDSLFNEQSAKQLQEASVRFDSELKDSQIAAQQAEISYRNRLTAFMAGGILLLLIAAVITYMNQVKVRRLNRQVLRQKGELEQLNNVKDRIFSAISHDIRTPLSSLFSFSRLLSEGNVTPEKLPLYTAQLNGQLSYAIGLMDNLLHWARSQMQGFHPTLEPIDLSTATAEAVNLASAEAAQKGVLIKHEVAASTRFVKADKQMLALTLRNLIHNAIKFTPKGGCITLSAEAVGNEQWLSVADTGIGIDAAGVAAFNKQEPMSSRPGTAGEKGTGLGLLLCKSLAGVMGGRLELCSRPGNGSRFALVLPAA